MGNECSDALLLYGRCLLELGRAENCVLGNALKEWFINDDFTVSRWNLSQTVRRQLLCRSRTRFFFRSIFEWKKGFSSIEYDSQEEIKSDQFEDPEKVTPEEREKLRDDVTDAMAEADTIDEEPSKEESSEKKTEGEKDEKADAEKEKPKEEPKKEESKKEDEKMETEDEKKESKPEEAEKAKDTKAEEISESKTDETKVNF